MRKYIVLLFILASFTASSQIRISIVVMKNKFTPFGLPYLAKQRMEAEDTNITFRITHDVTATQTLQTVYANGWLEVLGRGTGGGGGLDTTGLTPWIHHSGRTVLRNISDKVGIWTNIPDSSLTVNGSIDIVKTSLINGLTIGKGKGNNQYNTILGNGAFSGNVNIYSAIQNTAIGEGTLSGNTDGSTNTAVGAGALRNNTTGTGNTVIGVNANANGIATENVCIGNNTFGYHGSGTRNIAIGVWSQYGYGMSLDDGGSYNVGIGSQSLQINNGSYNNAIGSWSMWKNRTGSYNSAMGSFSLYSNTTGDSSVAIGGGALYNQTTGRRNTALGYNACVGSLGGFTGKDNTVIGCRAVNEITSGSGNTILGMAAGLELTSGNYNTYLGDSAGVARWAEIVFKSGHNNIGIGKYSLGQLESGSNNIAIGLRAGYHSDGNNNIFIGDSSGKDYTSLSRMMFLMAKDTADNGIIFNKANGRGLWNGRLVVRDTAEIKLLKATEVLITDTGKIKFDRAGNIIMRGGTSGISLYSDYWTTAYNYLLLGNTTNPGWELQSANADYSRSGTISYPYSSSLISFNLRKGAKNFQMILDTVAFFSNRWDGSGHNLGKKSIPWDSSYFDQLNLRGLSGAGSTLGIDGNGNVIKTSGGSSYTGTSPIDVTGTVISYKPDSLSSLMRRKDTATLVLSIVRAGHDYATKSHTQAISTITALTDTLNDRYHRKDTATVLLSRTRAGHDYWLKSDTGANKKLAAYYWAVQQFSGKAATGQQFYLGTTQVAINRGSGALSLAGVSIDGGSGSVANALSNGYGINSLTYNGSSALSIVADSSKLWSTVRASHVSSYPTLNQSTTGSAGSVANALSNGYGINSLTYNGSSALTIVADSSKLVSTVRFSHTSAYPTLNQNTTGTANVAGGTLGAIPYQTGANTTGVVAATATANKILLSGASDIPTWSTSTIPTSAGATANKVLLSNGTNYALSTPTFPNAASPTIRKNIVSDGTNWVASTETWAVPGTVGNVLTSDGTNWVSSAGFSAATWTVVKVAGMDWTTTTQSLSDITGLSFTASASTTYLLEAWLDCGTSAVTTGVEFGINSTGTSPTVLWGLTGTGTSTTVVSAGNVANNTADATALLTTSGMSGFVHIWGIVKSGTGSPVISIRGLKVTSGTLTVRIGSSLMYRVQ